MRGEPQFEEVAAADSRVTDIGSSGILVARDDRIEIELAAVEQDSQTVVLK